MNRAVKRINVLNRLTWSEKLTSKNDWGERTKFEITDKRLWTALQNLLSKALDEKFVDDFTGEAKKLAIQELLKDIEYGDGFDTVTNIID